MTTTNNTDKPKYYSKADGSIQVVNPGQTATFVAYGEIPSVVVTLTDAATINWNMQENIVADVSLAGNRTMAAPTNIKAGQTYILRVIQTGGGNTITWNSIFKWPGGVAPTLSAGAGAKDLISFYSPDGTVLYGVGSLNFS